MPTTFRRTRPGASRFIDVADLEEGTVICHHGSDRTITRVERSPDNYHWRVRLDDEQRLIVPPTARFTRAAP